MAKRFNLFNFLEKKMEVAEISPVTQKLLDQIAFKELALHIAVSYIANTLSKCEFKVFENGNEVKNRLYYMLNVSPNPNENSSQFINKFIEKYYYDGHSLIVENGNNLHCADNFDIDDTNPLKENIFYNVTFNCHQIKKKHKASDVFYFRLDNENVKGLIDSVYMQYSDVISMALAAYQRTNGTKYKLLLEQYKAGDPEFKKVYEEVIQKQLKSFTENPNAVYPQFRGSDLQEFNSGNGKDTGDIIAMRKEVFEIVAQAFKVPLPMLYGNMTNVNEIVSQYLTFCIDPLADMIGEEITRKYYDFDEWTKGSRVVVDTTCIKHVDILEVAAAVDKLISSGVLNVDELRNIIGYNPLGTEFSTSYFMTKNYELAENALVRSEE